LKFFKDISYEWSPPSSAELKTSSILLLLPSHNFRTWTLPTFALPFLQVINVVSISLLY